MTESPSAEAQSRPTSGESRRQGAATLVVFFSRAGENYYYGDRTDLEVGNTKVVAQMIAERIDCDVFEIKAAHPYSADYDATVERNVREQNSDARPEIANQLPATDGYARIILASPLWNVRPPMIMRSFTDQVDFAGTAVYPLTTYAVSGIGSAEDEYREACPGATLGESLAVRGEEVRDAGPHLDGWLQRTGLT